MQYNGNNGVAPMARMAYGAGAASARQEAAARTELFTGAGQPAPVQVQQPMSYDDMNNKQLMQHAVETHKETTASAKRGLQAVEQMKEIQSSTHAALRDQGEQMRRIETDMDKIGEDLSYSERILRFMRLCCCFSFFCSCCTEPDRAEKDQQWRGASGSQPPSSYAGPQQPGPHKKLTAAQRKQQAAAQAAAGAPAYPGVRTDGLAGLGLDQEAAAVQTETREQDKYLDEISRGLDQLKMGAQRMQEEVRGQEQQADRIGQDAVVLHDKLRSVNREGFKRI
ncbi:hypothetical protein COO60DRAFT_1624263 [Scenedesmus sp. NREL 46B-D3]|nr:hypothetical protein COO60DRAFT_1624263 [Scenedesmus sp. NREL 46B-D3]